MTSVDLSVNIAGLKLKNPVIAASGTCGYGRELAEFFDLNRLGGISVKGLTLEPRMGNRPPRIAETPAGILNSVGLQNPGLDAFIREELPFLRTLDTVKIVNIAGNTPEEYCLLAERLSACDIDAIELNVSCPNVKEGGISFGKSPEGVKRIVSQVKPFCGKKPLIVKLTPNVTDIGEIALAAQDGGADAVSLINTLLGMAIDIYSRRPILGNNFGGLSGPAVKSIAVRMVYEVSRRVKIPVIGMGGIVKGEDAIEFMLAGASAVMVGTGTLVYPDACLKVLEGIKDYLEKTGHKSCHDIIGKLRLW